MRIVGIETGNRFPGSSFLKEELERIAEGFSRLPLSSQRFILFALLILAGLWSASLLVEGFGPALSRGPTDPERTSVYYDSLFLQPLNSSLDEMSIGKPFSPRGMILQDILPNQVRDRLSD